jgi:GDP-L-fucose synthase
MNILVLGGTGFVGTNVMEVLSKAKGMKPINISKSNGYDLQKKTEVIRAIKEFKPTYIVNCAAHVGSLNYVTEFAADVIKNNTEMIIALYEAISEINKDIVLINPIANCSYPGDAITYKENEWMNGPIHNSVLSYGNSRRLLWAFSECYKMQYGLKTINLLVPNMYGEHDSTDPNKAHALNALIGKFVKGDFENNKVLNIWGSGKVVREWLYAKDFAKVIELIINDEKLQGILGENTNIAQMSGLTITELVNIINKQFDSSFELEYDTTKPDGAPQKVMDDEKFRSIFKDFRFTDFEVGIAKTVESYKSQLPY